MLCCRSAPTLRKLACALTWPAPHACCVPLQEGGMGDGEESSVAASASSCQNNSTFMPVGPSIAPSGPLLDAVEGVLSTASTFSFDVWQLSEATQGECFICLPSCSCVLHDKWVPCGVRSTTISMGSKRQ